jgi:drug/metabolite transporter (DMT)-like permease
MQNFRLLLLLALAVLAISSAAILVVLAGAPGPVTAFWRLILSIPLFLILSRSLSFPSDQKALFFPAVAGIALGIHFASWMESLFYASVAVSTTIVCTHALFSAIFSTALGERPKARQVLGVVLAIVSVYFLSGADPNSRPEGIILALIGAVAGGIYFTTGRFSRNRIDFGAYVLLTYVTAAIVTLVISIMNNLSLFNYRLETWVYFLLLAAIPMMLGHTLINYILRHMGVVPVTASVIGEAVGATILAYFILGQSLQLQAYFYMFVILLGIALAIWHTEK